MDLVPLIRPDAHQKAIRVWRVRQARTLVAAYVNRAMPTKLHQFNLSVSMLVFVTLDTNQILWEYLLHFFHQTPLALFNAHHANKVFSKTLLGLLHVPRAREIFTRHWKAKWNALHALKIR